MTKEQIQEIVGKEHEIVFACRTGSQIFCSNPHDEDIAVVIKSRTYKHQSFRVGNTDVFCDSLDDCHKKATFCSEYPSLYDALSYQFAKHGDTLICGKFPLPDWDWFDWKLQAVKEALTFGENKYFHPRIFGRDGKSCSKRMVWALAIYYAVKNGSIVYTNEQRSVMQKCHDCELPKEYAYLLKEKLEEIKGQLEGKNG